jgi:hypothetical protein
MLSKLADFPYRTYSLGNCKSGAQTGYCYYADGAANSDVDVCNGGCGHVKNLQECADLCKKYVNENNTPDLVKDGYTRLRRYKKCEAAKMLTSENQCKSVGTKMLGAAMRFFVSKTGWSGKPIGCFQTANTKNVFWSPLNSGKPSVGDSSSQPLCKAKAGSV